MVAYMPDPPRAGQGLHTSCGRDLTIGTIALGDAHRPARRVTVNIGECPDCHDGTWVALTAAEARLLATALLAQAETAENI